VQQTLPSSASLQRVYSIHAFISDIYITAPQKKESSSFCVQLNEEVDGIHSHFWYKDKEEYAFLKSKIPSKSRRRILIKTGTITFFN
jgi:hypothetical protein